MTTIESIEQKAKAYDEALEIAKDLHDNHALGMLFIYETCEQIFPQLKESEDERVVRDLVNFLKSPFVNENITDEKVTPWIAWLKKQSKKKPTQEVEPAPIFRIGDILKRKGKDYTFRVDRIQGGYYHCDRNHGAFFPIEEQGNWKLVEQKSAWSKEDELRAKYTIYFLDTAKKHYASTVKLDACIDWLKSIKERMKGE